MAAQSRSRRSSRPRRAPPARCRPAASAPPAPAPTTSREEARRATRRYGGCRRWAGRRRPARGATGTASSCSWRRPGEGRPRPERSAGAPPGTRSRIG